MAGKETLKIWVYQAVESLGGEATVLETAKEIWNTHENELRDSGDMFFTWQYDMRWAAQALRKESKMTFSGRKWAIKK